MISPRRSRPAPPARTRPTTPSTGCSTWRTTTSTRATPRSSTQELPVVKDELAWDASQVNSTGLLVTTSSDDADWDFYDPGKTGEVTEYNLLYYKALLDGAVLATAAGDSTDAATYTSDAAALKTAINANLYDSSTGLYYLSNTDTSTVAQDANSLAVLYGVAPAVG